MALKSPTEGWVIFLFVCISPKYPCPLCVAIPFAPSSGQNCCWPFASVKCPTKWIASFVNKKKNLREGGFEVLRELELAGSPFCGSRGGWWVYSPFGVYKSWFEDYFALAFLPPTVCSAGHHRYVFQESTPYFLCRRGLAFGAKLPSDTSATEKVGHVCNHWSEA